jgi:hypothetical protein
MVPSGLAGFVDLHLDPRVLAFTATLTMASSVLFGLAPAWQLSRLAQLGTRRAIGHGRRGTRSALVILEVAVSFVLVVGAGLLVRTLWHLRAVDPGFRPAGMLTASLMRKTG